MWHDSRGTLARRNALKRSRIRKAKVTHRVFFIVCLMSSRVSNSAHELCAWDFKYLFSSQTKSEGHVVLLTCAGTWYFGCLEMTLRNFLTVNTKQPPSDPPTRELLTSLNIISNDFSSASFRFFREQRTLFVPAERWNDGIKHDLRVALLCHEN